MAIRDMEVYAGANGCRLSRYRDSGNLGGDLIVDPRGCGWLADRADLPADEPTKTVMRPRLHRRLNSMACCGRREGESLIGGCAR